MKIIIIIIITVEQIIISTVQHTISVHWPK